ncbi:MAG: START-like domain-containing protein [Bacteroidota bacterium]
MSDIKKYELEYIIKSSPGMLYNRLSTPDGLSLWFADDINVEKGIFTFIWDGNEQQARIVDQKMNKYIRFQWIDKEDDTYFEFRIEKDDLTSEVALIVIDFTDEDELEEATQLWDSQINNLMRILGS